MEDRVLVVDLTGVAPFDRGGCSRVLLLGVFDGHAGHEAAEHLASQFTSALLNSPLLHLKEVEEAPSTSPSLPETSSPQCPPDDAPSAMSHPTLPLQNLHPALVLIRSPGRCAQGELGEDTKAAGSSKEGGCQRDYGGALREALLRCEEELLDAALAAGSTALVALLVDGNLHIANVGDCRAVVCDEAQARPLTVDHKPVSNVTERARLEALGAEVSSDGYVRSSDGRSDIALSRALGGAPLKRPQSLMTLQQMGSDVSASSLSGGLRHPSLPTLNCQHSISHQLNTMHRTSSDASSQSLGGFPSISSLAAADSAPSPSSGRLPSPSYISGTACSGSGEGVSPQGNISRYPDTLGPCTSPRLCAPFVSSRSPEPVGCASPKNPATGKGQSDTVGAFRRSLIPLECVDTSCCCSNNDGAGGSLSGNNDGVSCRDEHQTGLHSISSNASHLSVDAMSTAQSGVIAEPELFQYEVHQGSEFLILASDGLWDKLKNNEVVSRVRRWLSEDGLSVTEAAEKLVDMAITKYGADDNTSVILLRFSSRPLKPSPARFGNSALRRARSVSVMEHGAPHQGGAGGGCGDSPSASPSVIPSPSGRRIPPAGFCLESGPGAHQSLMAPLMLLPTLHEAASSPPSSIDDFCLHEAIYKGRTSQVCSATEKASGKPVAIKFYMKKKLTALERMRVDREIRIHAQLSHPGIVKFRSSFEDKSRVYMVLELIPEDLFTTLVTRERLDEEGAVLDVLVPSLEALTHLHDLGHIHRDVKPENILLTESGQVKLADFGLVVDMSEESPETRVCLGTLDYMAPEVLLCAEHLAASMPEDEEVVAYNDRVDSWAIGVLAFELLIGYAPFEGNSKEETCISILGQEPCYDHYPSLQKGAMSFIKAALTKDPDFRPSCKDLLDHPWIRAWRDWGENPSQCARPDSEAFHYTHQWSFHAASSTGTLLRSESSFDAKTEAVLSSIGAATSPRKQPTVGHKADEDASSRDVDPRPDHPQSAAASRISLTKSSSSREDGESRGSGSSIADMATRPFSSECWPSNHTQGGPLAPVQGPMKQVDVVTDRLRAERLSAGTEPSS